jgi:uncharacterized membrane protein
MKNFISDLSKQEFPIHDQVHGGAIRESILNLIQQDNPDFTKDSFLSTSELNEYREKYIANTLQLEIGELSILEKTVIKTIAKNTTISNKAQKEKVKTTFGQKLADKVAAFGGSWTFILSFGAFILLWVLLNVLFFVNKGFDPYPFILLNLILSCIAAMQAPVIMMSQNRQESKDRKRAQEDYMINLKSELEIRTLHEKVDHILISQRQEFIEIQKVQIEMLSDIMKDLKQMNLKAEAKGEGLKAKG